MDITNIENTTKIDDKTMAVPIIIPPPQTITMDQIVLNITNLTKGITLWRALYDKAIELGLKTTAEINSEIAAAIENNQSDSMNNAIDTMNSAL